MLMLPSSRADILGIWGIYGDSVCFYLAQTQTKSLCWLSPDTFFLKKKRGCFWWAALGAGTSTQDWWSSRASSCCLVVFGILRTFAGMSQLVMMSEQKLQVKHRSKRWQELNPGSAPTNLPSQLAQVGMCHIKRGQRQFGGHREGQSCPGSTSSQVNTTLFSYMWVEMSWDLLDAAASCTEEQWRSSRKCNALGNTGASGAISHFRSFQSGTVQGRKVASKINWKLF